MDQPPILKSRKFWIMVVDGVASLAIYFITKYMAPAAAEDVIKVLAIVQPIVLAVVASITVQNVQAMKYLTPFEPELPEDKPQ
jgi:hypothetical protein